MPEITDQELNEFAEKCCQYVEQILTGATKITAPDGTVLPVIPAIAHELVGFYIAGREVGRKKNTDGERARSRNLNALALTEHP